MEQKLGRYIIEEQQRRSSKGLLAGGRIALVGEAIVLVVIVDAILFFVFGCDATPVVEVTNTPIPAEEPVVVIDTPTPTEESEPTSEPEPTATPTETPEPTDTPTPGPTDTPAAPPVPAGMVLVPAGPFEMGSDADVGLAECKKLSANLDKCERSWYEDEEPKHTVTLDDFYIDQYEVTNVQFTTFLNEIQADVSVESVESDEHVNYEGNTIYDLICTDCGSWKDRITWDGAQFSVLPGYEDHPVALVSWYGAKAYCEWRGARLPTEAEWEKAARGTDGRQYPWGDTFDGSRANFCDSNCNRDQADSDYDDGYADTAPVGSYPNGVSPYGVYDMAGNVLEWVADWYDKGYYKISPSENPLGPDDQQNFTGLKVLRGGSWGTGNLRAAYHATNRSYNLPSSGNSHVGFRCAVGAP